MHDRLISFLGRSMAFTSEACFGEAAKGFATSGSSFPLTALR